MAEPDSDDIDWMRQAIELARKAEGRTGDNPHVGCIIVAQGKVIGRGWTQPPGRHHAEAMAIAEAISQGYRLDQAVLYSTLEPCSFVGRTPACARTIVEHRLIRVVIGIRDPHPKVNGSGVDLIRRAGIEVTESICETEIRESLQNWLIRFEPKEN